MRTVRANDPLRRSDCLRAGGTRVSWPTLAGVVLKDCAFADGKYYTTFVIDRGTVLSAGESLAFYIGQTTALPFVDSCFGSDALWIVSIVACRKARGCR